MLWIFVFAFASFVLGASTVSNCEKTIITQQRTIETQGVKLNFTISECADAGKKQYRPLSNEEVLAASKAERRSTASDSSPDFVKRQTSQCTLPAPHCVCDYPCTDVQCFGPRQFILSSDCETLGSILTQFNGTFLVQPGQTAGITLTSCTFSVYNNEAPGFVLEYCYSSLGRVGHSQLNAICPGKEAYCSGGTLPGYSMFFVEQIATPFI